MPQTTKSRRSPSRGRSSKNGSSASRTRASSRRRRGSSNGARTTRTRSSGATRTRSSRSQATRSRSNGSRAAAKRRRSSELNPITRMRSTADGAVSKAGDAVGKAGGAVGNASGRFARLVSKARTPLIAGGAALAGVAGGVAISRGRSKSRVGRLAKPSIPGSLRRVDLSKLNLDALTSAGRRVREIGEQVGDIADATERTRREHG